LKLPKTNSIQIASLIYIAHGALFLVVLAVGLIPYSLGELSWDRSFAFPIIVQMVASIGYLVIGIGYRRKRYPFHIFALSFAIFWIILSPFYLIMKAPITWAINGIMLYSVSKNWRMFLSRKPDNIGATAV
jgi:hypothetical protein